MLKQTHAELGFQHPQNGSVQQFCIRLSASEHFFEFLTITDRFRHLYVHPCFHGKKPCFSDSLPDSLDLVGIVNAAVVADTQTVKPHLFSEKFREQPV